MKNTKTKKSLFESFLSLSLMYGLDLLLPLLVMPFLVRTIGIEKVGLLNFAMSSLSYLAILVNYGFNLTATKEIAQNKGHLQKQTLIFYRVMTTKLFLILLSVIILIPVVLAVPQYREFYYIYLLVFAGLCFQSLFPIWFFQGQQNLKFPIIQNAVIKSSFTVLIFFVVAKEADFWKAPLLTTIGYFVAMLASFVYMVKKYKVSFVFSTFSEVKSQLKTGLYVFLSQVKISFFSNFNVILLGFLAGNVAVGYFTSADKIIRALAVIQVPVTATLFPYFSNLLLTDKPKAFAMINKIALLSALAYLPVLILFFWYAPEITILVFGKGMEPVAQLIRIMMPLPLFIILNNFSGTQMLLNMGKDKWYFNVLLSTAVLNIIVVLPLTLKFGYVGTSYAVLFSEFYLCLAMYGAFIMAKKQFLRLNTTT